MTNRREFVGRLAGTAVAVGIGAVSVPAALDAEEIRAMRAATGPGASYMYLA